MGKKDELNWFMALLTGSVVAGSRVRDRRESWSVVWRERACRISRGPKTSRTEKARGRRKP